MAGYAALPLIVCQSFPATVHVMGQYSLFHAFVISQRINFVVLAMRCYIQQSVGVIVNAMDTCPHGQRLVALLRSMFVLIIRNMF